MAHVFDGEPVLSEAHAGLANDEPLMNAGHPLPGGRVARLVDIMARQS